MLCYKIFFILKLLVLFNICSINADMKFYVKKLEKDLAELQKYINTYLKNIESGTYWEMQPSKIKKYVEDLKNFEKLSDFTAINEYVFSVKKNKSTYHDDLYNLKKAFDDHLDDPNNFDETSVDHEIDLNTLTNKAFAELYKIQITKNDFNKLNVYKNKIEDLIKNKEKINGTVEEAKKLFLIGQPVEAFNALPIKIYNNINEFENLVKKCKQLAQGSAALKKLISYEKKKFLNKNSKSLDSYREFMKNTHPKMYNQINLLRSNKEKIKILIINDDDMENEKTKLNKLEESLKIKIDPKINKEEKKLEEAKKQKIKKEIGAWNLYFKIYKNMSKTVQNILKKIKENFLKDKYLNELAKHYINIRLYIGLNNAIEEIYNKLNDIVDDIISNPNILLEDGIRIKKTILFFRDVIQEYLNREDQITSKFEDVIHKETYLTSQGTNSSFNNLELEISNLKNLIQTYLPNLMLVYEKINDYVNINGVDLANKFENTNIDQIKKYILSTANKIVVLQDETFAEIMIELCQELF